MTDRRCAACGASNPEGAAWCSQCYARFEEPSAPTEPLAPPDAATGRPARRAVHELAGASGTPSPGSGFRRVGDELRWECVSCGADHPMDVDPCPVCGTAFSARFLQPEPARDPAEITRAQLAGRLLPGLGHVRLDDLASGIARITLFAVWVLGALALALASGTRGLLAVVPLALGAGAVYVTSDLDVARLGRREPQLLQGRALLGLVVGVSVLTAVGLALAIARGGV